MVFVMGVIGAVIGSFVNVVSVRGTKGEDFVHGRSYCPHCHHSLHALDLLPILSYLFLRGKCRYCKQPISIRYFIVEIIFSILFCLVAYLKSPLEIVGYFFCTICMLIALMDFDSYEVDLRLLFILAIVGLYNRMNAVEEAILSMMIGLVQYGLWCRKMDLERGSFRNGRCILLNNIRSLLFTKSNSLYRTLFFYYWRGSSD